jgi:hypothetical protein
MSKTQNQLTSFEEDCIWMSYRYCIGRQTIAAQMHADGIANYVYDRLNSKRLQFMSEDICREIYDSIKFNHFIDMGWYGNIPKQYFKPLDVIYEIFNAENIDSIDKISEIKTISINWNGSLNKYDYSIYRYQDNDCKFNNHSFNDISSLEVWQRLANLFDKQSHKYCKLVDDTIVEYYEYWRHGYVDGVLQFKKVKCPINGKQHNFSICTYIPDENIKEDNIDNF